MPVIKVLINVAPWFAVIGAFWCVVIGANALIATNQGATYCDA